MCKLHIYYKFGLLLIFILSISNTRYNHASSETVNHNTSDENYSADYDEYYDDSVVDQGYDNGTINTVSPEKGKVAENTRINTNPTTKQNKSLFSILLNNYRRSNFVMEPTCPKFCQCHENYKHILCNGAGLTEVPGNLPATALIIDLSQNNITELRTGDFANITKVREINLSGNQLSSISKEIFAGLSHLQRLWLNDNKIKHIEPDTFSGINDLSELDLSNNSILLNNAGPFLSQPNLLKLSCRNCSWTKLFDNTFKGLTGLQSLKLDFNDFNKKINTKAFLPLRNVTKLRLPDLKPQSVTELCNLLTAIDNISFEHFEISCFELVLGISFNESVTVVNDPAVQQKELMKTGIDEQESPQAHTFGNKEETIRGENVHTILTATSIASKPKEIKKEERKMGDRSDISNLTKPTAATRIEDEDMDSKALVSNVLSSITEVSNHSVTGSTVLPTLSTDNSHKVHISQDMINILLISIIITAIVGIIIGIICRKDVGGIKTKCCRTRKPKPKEQTHPAEEIPLNKLT
ncbi:slit homolog 3 protein isoform X2 [Ceratitis capitata]|uniref:Leucine-rich repeat and immunoglobulin-like domain-containing nogo receptor-interacting protein 4 n=2 Tax=Ceratitis capitata TaxID=7213 RepID=W8BSL5_CERCA|nr:slit homolog 3 protein isoform X2 [Ceratitis capitata]